MKSIIILTLFFFSNLGFAKGKTCTYEFDLENSIVQGTGYKYTEKAAVTGSFTGFELNKQEKKESAKTLLDGLVVTVNLLTLDSGNALRDKNMRETLFSGIIGDSVATVTVKKVTDKQIETEMKINDKIQEIVFDYTLKDNTLTATGLFDAVRYALGDQIAALKKRCGSLHTGSDGKSVTWTDFKIEVAAKLKEACQ